MAGAVGTDTSASRAESNYNYFRDYDPSIGRYAESDPIGLLASLNTYTYVDDNPLFWGDRFGLQRGPAPAETYYSRGRIMPNPMSYERPSNAMEAAGYFDNDYNFICVKWSCPDKPGMCTPHDTKTSDDFIPPSYDPERPPAGCTCADPRYAMSNGPEGVGVNDFMEGASAYRERARGLRLIRNLTHK